METNSIKETSHMMKSRSYKRNNQTLEVETILETIRVRINVICMAENILQKEIGHMTEEEAET